MVLGAGGYLGSALCRYFHHLSGYRVLAVFRREPSHLLFDQSLTADAFADDWAATIPSDMPVILINCAFDFAAVGEASHAAKYATFERNLAALCAKAPTRLINISSMSAHAGCRTDYGTEKMLVEALFARHGGISVRPGLIASWRWPGAAFLNLITITKASRIVPILWARGSGFHFCDLEAVVLGIHRVADMRLNKPHVASFCYHDRLRLGAIVTTIAHRNGLSRLKVPVPWWIAYLLLRVKEKLIGKSKVRADSIVDFAYSNPKAERRGFFARLVGSHRAALEAISQTDTDAGFYHLEPHRRAAATPLAADVAGRLRGLPDAERVRHHGERVVAAGN